MFSLKCSFRQTKLGKPISIALDGPAAELLPGSSTRTLVFRTVLWLLWASALCLPVQSRQSKSSRAWMLVEAGEVSWMGNRLGLLKFHQKDLIPGSGTVLGRGSKLTKPPVSLFLIQLNKTVTLVFPREGYWDLWLKVILQNMGVKLLVCWYVKLAVWPLARHAHKSLWRQQDLNICWSLSMCWNAL